MAGGAERLIEVVRCKIERNEADVARDLGELGGALALLALRVWVIDLEHHRVGELWHAPGSAIESRAQDHELSRRGLADSRRRSRRCGPP